VSREAEIVVIGAGMVGAAFACLLAEQGDEISIAVLDIREPPIFDADADYGPRVSAISRASSSILKAAGVWKTILAARASPYREMCVWDSGHRIGAPGTVRFDAADIGEAELGHIVENDLIQHALIERLKHLDCVSLVCPARAVEIQATGRRASISLEDGSTLRARLVVGADGTGSPTREMLGIETRCQPYDQTAVVCHVSTERSHLQTAWQRFLPEGPVALLPLADGRSSVVWSTSPEEARRLTEIGTTEFLEELTQATEGVLGRITGTGQRFAFPLRMQNARSYISGRAALIGDAAHTVHPLAGQGVNLGLLDAAALAEVVIDARDSGRDPGDFRVLRRYERWRKGENLVAAHGIDAIGRLFRATGPVTGALRRAGATLVNETPLVKNEIVRRAMGISGDLPKFARPSEAWQKQA
jgi:2-octaprenylphenol hydroxylase